MAQIEATFAAHILANAAVAAVVGTRIYPVRVPQSRPGGTNFPALVYRRLRTRREKTMKGSDGLATPTIRVHCVAMNYEDAKDLCDLVRLAVDDWRTSTLGTVPGSIRRCFLVDEADDFEEPVYADDVFAFFPYLDFELTYTETKPAP